MTAEEFVQALRDLFVMLRRMEKGMSEVREAAEEVGQRILAFEEARHG